MKTNQIIFRPMDGFSVPQRTKDGMFNATSLMKQWNERSGQKKNINHYLDNSTTKEFIEALINENQDIREYELPINQVFTKTKCKTNKDGSKVAGEYWMCPLMFIDFAMWLNPSFKVKVLRFVFDELLALRDQSGENYKKLSAAVSTIISKNQMPDFMQRLSRSMNIIVYGKHESEIRNKKGVVPLMRELSQLEYLLTQFILCGVIKSEDDMRVNLNRIYHQKNNELKLINK